MQPKRLGRQVGGIFQHVADQRLDRGAVMMRDVLARWQAVDDVGRGQDQTAGAAQRLEHVRRIKFGQTHRQPPAARSAHRGARHRPIFAFQIVTIGEQVGLVARHRGDGIGAGGIVGRPRLDTDLMVDAHAGPAQMDTVEVQHQPRDGGVVRQMIVLFGGDFGDAGQGAAPDSKARRAWGLQPDKIVGQTRQVIGGQHRVAAARQDQCVPCPDHPRAEPMGRAKPVQRIKRGDRLHRAGRRQQRPRLAQGQRFGPVGQRKGHTPGQAGPRDKIAGFRKRSRPGAQVQPLRG